MRFLFSSRNLSRRFITKKPKTITPRTATTNISYFIYSRFSEAGWFEWQKEGCPYYPCHFEGQSCDFCYCPFYPCGDETLGEWIDSTTLGGKVFACTNCQLLHEPKRARYLKEHPDASFEEVRDYV